jgi:hypothetical protein
MVFIIKKNYEPIDAVPIHAETMKAPCNLRRSFDFPATFPISESLRAFCDDRFTMSWKPTVDGLTSAPLANNRK